DLASVRHDITRQCDGNCHISSVQEYPADAGETRWRCDLSHKHQVTAVVQLRSPDTPISHSARPLLALFSDRFNRRPCPLKIDVAFQARWALPTAYTSAESDIAPIVDPGVHSEIELTASRCWIPGSHYFGDT